MNRKAFLSTALALTLPLQATSLALAAPQDTAPAEEAAEDAAEDAGKTDPAVEEVFEDDGAEINDWEALDAELRGLDSLKQDYKPMTDIWGYGRVSFFQQKDGGRMGVNMDNIRLNFTGRTGDYSYRLTTELSSGVAGLQDAWISTALGEEISFTFGLFRTPFLRSGLIEARDLLFIARTRNGIFYSQRDQGVMLNGDHGRFHWAAAVQNGADGTIDRSLATIQSDVNVIGEPPLPWEGAYKAGSNTRLTLGAGLSNDDAASDGTAYSIQAYGIHRGVSVQAEWLDYGADYSLVNPTEQRGGTSPWSVTTSYMIVAERYELALRYDDFDDQKSPLNYNRRTLTVGINRYIEGHDIKWQLNYAAAHKGGEQDGLQDALVAIGLTASF